MRNFVLLLMAVCAAALYFPTTPAQAQRALWVSATGNDGNNCSESSPCATFQGVINHGAVAQINCLNSGNYGTVTITGPIIIDCGVGNIGNIVASGNATGITINTNSSYLIVLRHLSVTGFGASNTSSKGIDAESFASGTLIVENCEFTGLQGGILFNPTSGRGLLQVSDSHFFNMQDGILVEPASGQIASVTLDRVQLIANSDLGLYLGGAGVVAGTMSDSIVAQNSQGVAANASQVFFTIQQSSIVANLQYGIVTGSAGSFVNVGGSTIGGNGTGINAAAGSLTSFGNNQFSANASDGTFTTGTPLR